jgi:hypothetical protein
MELAPVLISLLKKLTLWDYRFPIILATHERTRRTVPPLPAPLIFPLNLMDEASAPG